MTDETLPGQLEALNQRMNAADVVRAEMSVKIDATVTTLAAHDVKLNTIITGLAENTAISNTVKDALTAGRVGRSVLIWVGGVAGAVAAIWGAVQAFAAHPH